MKVSDRELDEIWRRLMTAIEGRVGVAILTPVTPEQGREIAKVAIEAVGTLAREEG